MVSQNELRQQPADLELYLATESGGEVRTRQSHPGQIQRAVITDRSEGPYKIQAVLRTCVHGQWDAVSNRPASLIVVDYQLVALPKGACFSRMHTRFEFSDDNANVPSNPEVKSFAPFKATAKWNTSTAGKTNTSGIALNLAPEIANTRIGDASYHRDGGTTRDQVYFDRGVGGITYDDKTLRANAVWWDISQNRSQDLGIPVNFRVAMLVERKSQAKFKGTFEITAHGGFGYVIENWRDRFVRKTAIDDDIVFDPAAEPFGNDLEDAQGNVVAIDTSQLGVLAGRERLIGLSKVEGLSTLTGGGTT